ncbi:DnaJ C-terminal domain-containing protein [Streptomyces sp. NPDC052236]|uniref:DnaJ C-terminal domain-containing protein n=1 Tax=Streptomyces sp. NPDC052236 TaxID=3365686 RepID=UPI0037D50A6F
MIRATPPRRTFVSPVFHNLLPEASQGRQHKPCPTCAATRVAAQGSAGCTTCEGSGQAVHGQRTKRVRIPAGIREVQQIRIREHGGPGKHGGVLGDLYVTVHIDR